jgi:hypothetical protein
MTFINKLKTKFELGSLSTYSVTQEITLPIYESSLKGMVDSSRIGKKCLEIQDNNEVQEDLSFIEILKKTWKSQYYTRDDKSEDFGELIKLVEDKLNSLPAMRNSKMRFTVIEWWIIIFGKDSTITWHDHCPYPDTFTRFSATYYPEVPLDAQPLEFKDKDKILSIPVVKDKIVFFPSTLSHRVSECISDEPRIMVGFNFLGLS